MAWVFALLAFGLVVAFALVLAGRLPQVQQSGVRRMAGQAEHPGQHQRQCPQ